MKDQIIINGVIFMSALSLIAIVILFYFNYKYDSHCGKTIKKLFEEN